MLPSHCVNTLWISWKSHLAQGHMSINNHHALCDMSCVHSFAALVCTTTCSMLEMAVADNLLLLLTCNIDTIQITWHD